MSDQPDWRPSPHRVLLPVSGDAQQAYALMRRVPFFSLLTDRELTAVAGLMQRLDVAPGEFLFRQGSAPDGMYLVESGRVQIWAQIAGTRQDLAWCGPGEVACESRLVETMGSLASGEATEATRCWYLPARAFEGLRASRHPAAFATLAAATRSLTSLLRGAMLHYGGARGLSSQPDSPRLVDPFQTDGAPLPAVHHPLLRVLPQFKDWSNDELATLVASSYAREVKRGHRLLAEGEPPTALYLVVRGALETSTVRAGVRYRHGIRGPGRLVGHEAFGDQRPQLMDCTAKENSLLLELTQTQFSPMLAAQSPVALRLLDLICGSLGHEFGADCRHFSVDLASDDVGAPAAMGTTSVDMLRNASAT